MNKKSISFIIILTLIFLMSPAHLFSAEKKAEASKAATKSKSSPRVSDASYKIGAGDILKIITWKEVDFSLDEVLVRIDGMITFPLLDDVQAAGRTPLELKKDLEEKLKEYVAAPVVTVTVSNPISKQYYILGEVAKTGEYPLLKNLTVLQAFALAGGFTEWASKDEIIVLRKEKGKDKIIIVNYKKIAKGKDFSQNIKIEADDTIIVP
jgi:polysaccharide export outer membrane protein